MSSAEYLRRDGTMNDSQPKPWSARPLGVVHDGYVTTGGEDILQEACRRLDTKIISIRHDPSSKTLHAMVRTARRGSFWLKGGERFWLKVNGIKDQLWNRHRQAEFDAQALVLLGVSKPQITRMVDWREGDVFWRARLMTLAPSPAVAQEHTRMPAHAPATEQWCRELKASLDALRLAPCSRTLGPASEVHNLIRTHIDDVVPTEASEWYACHGDLNWTNVTAPRCMLLDWENWCMAPRSYDLGRLLAFSVFDQSTLDRLFKFFEEEVVHPSGRVGILAGISMVKHQIAHQQTDPMLSEPIAELIQRIIATPAPAAMPAPISAPI
jgi:hypothetical protein